MNFKTLETISLCRGLVYFTCVLSLTADFEQATTNIKIESFLLQGDKKIYLLKKSRTDLMIFRSTDPSTPIKQKQVLD